MGFREIWAHAARYRRVSRELEPLVGAVYDAVTRADVAETKATLERLLAFLSSPAGRTDANCCVTDAFFSHSDADLSPLPEALQKVIDDMGGALHDTIYAPHIAANFESTPEQLLERVRKIG